MCGFCGKLTFNGAPGDAALVERMVSTLSHRGPDGRGVHVGPSIALAECRLAVIDLRPEAIAPLPNEDGSVWVVFNGEIYNHHELRAELRGRGHLFRTNTDTEVLVHLYEEYGSRAVHRLRGMFAFVIWDANKRRLWGARDRLGKKPLVYARTRDAFYFASEIKAILADPAISVEPDYRSLDAFLTYQYVPSPRSAFAGISKLSAGRMFTCGADGEFRIERYWSPPVPQEVMRDEDELAEELLARLREAVRLRLAADVPVGAFLSGGIDSGTVVALMAEASSNPVRTFSIGFNDSHFNELALARTVADRYSTEHQEMIVTPDAAAMLPDLVRFYDEPFGDASALPTFYVSKLARQEVTVALTGDGGDENFAGYDNYAHVDQWTRLDAVPKSARVMVGRGAVSLLEALPGNRAARAARAFTMVAATLPERHRLTASIWKPQEKRNAYTPDFAELALAGSIQVEPTDAWYSSDVDPVAWMMYHDQQFYLPDCLMVKTDIASMANSLEVRCPMLDHEFIEFTATIPRRLKSARQQRKLILKKAVQHLLPPEILHKRKTGFGLPVARWLREDLKPLLQDTVLTERAAHRRLFQPAALERMAREHWSGTRDWSARLWSVLMLELWFRRYIDRERTTC